MWFFRRCQCVSFFCLVCVFVSLSLGSRFQRKMCIQIIPCSSATGPKNTLPTPAMLHRAYPHVTSLSNTHGTDDTTSPQPFRSDLQLKEEEQIGRFLSVTSRKSQNKAEQVSSQPSASDLHNSTAGSLLARLRRPQPIGALQPLLLFCMPYNTDCYYYTSS